MLFFPKKIQSIINDADKKMMVHIAERTVNIFDSPVESGLVQEVKATLIWESSIYAF
jgi:hypothetical protein